MEAVDELVRIRIPASTEHAGIYAIHADVPWHCISCARREANLFNGRSYDGSRALSVTQWKNPCDQIETYVAIRQWLNFRAELEYQTEQ
jgi:hypothetical protein